MPIDDEAHWKPLVSFKDDPSPSYVNGFEAGQIWQRMRNGESPIEATVHIENRGTIQAMADADGYEAKWAECEVDGWIDLTMTRRPQRGHLSIVE